MTRIVTAVLAPMTAGDSPAVPVDPPTPLAVLALTRRELGGIGEVRKNVGAMVGKIAPTLNVAEAVEADDAQFTGEPSLVNQAFVAGLRLVKPVFDAVGFNLSGSSAEVPFFTDGKPPFFLTLGLDAKQSVDPATGMEVWTITPPNPSGDVVIAVHGGGFIGQASIFHWILYTTMARQTGATIVVPNYPVAKEDGTGGTAATVVPKMADFIAEQTGKYGAENVSVLGDSAGGTIALAATQELVRRCEEENEDCGSLPSALVLISPVLDLGMTNPDIALVDDPLLNYEASKANGKLWAGDLDTDDPLVSPLYGSFEGLPPTTIYGGSLDLRTPDILVLQQTVGDDPNFDFELRKGEIHDWIIFPFLPDAVAERPGLYEHLGLTDDV